MFGLGKMKLWAMAAFAAVIALVTAYTRGRRDASGRARAKTQKERADANERIIEDMAGHSDNDPTGDADWLRDFGDE